MTTDILEVSNFTKNEKEIMKLAHDKLCAELSEERGYKIDTISIGTNVKREYVYGEHGLRFAVDMGKIFEVEITAGWLIEYVDGKKAEKIYERYLELIAICSKTQQKPFMCRSLL